MNILIFEDKWEEVDKLFAFVNVANYDSTLVFEQYANWKKFEVLGKGLDTFRGVIVDIQLSLKSPFDGIKVIKKLKEINDNIPIAVITGYQNIDKSDDAIKGIPFYFKPLSIEDIQQILAYFDNSIKHSESTS